MKEKKIVIEKNDKKIECNILIEFEFDNNKYILYTDNSFTNNGDYNMYKGMINESGKIVDPTDIDVNEIFDKLIMEYKNKVLRGEI